MLRTIATTILTAAAAGAVAFAGTGTASAAPNAKCDAAARNGVTAVSQSVMCSGGSGSGESPTVNGEFPNGPDTQLVYDPQERIDGPRFRDFAIVPREN